MGNRNNISPLQSKEKERLQAKLSEWVAMHRSLLEVFLDAYCIVDLTNAVFEFNIGFEQLVGESHRKIQKAGSFCEILKTEHCPGKCPAVQIVQSGQALRLDELKAVLKSGQTLQLILSGIPILDEKGHILGSLLTIRDVSAENELQKKYDERKRDSITDGLTRLYNKVYSEEMLDRMIRLAFRNKQPLSVVLCDIDYFKKINDGFGHPAGDHVLSEVARLLKEVSRDSDIVGRFGGEEFIAVLHNSDKLGAQIFAERFRKRVETSAISFMGQAIKVSVSCGTDTFQNEWTPGTSVESTAKQMIGGADTALYFAKASGRNQTWQYEDLPVKGLKAKS